ncbi:MAG: hypothetical protein PUK40_04120 [Actinomycetaceae bacterium]|nr:hypothetical protein [Arcanobacterium sp.]MDD7505121.1 hypothetical protein [Actinomycetaceae bacterium]
MGLVSTSSKKKAQNALEGTGDVLQTFAQRAADAVDDAREWAAPKLAEAAEKLAPVAQDARERVMDATSAATVRAQDAADLVRTDYLPRAKRAAGAVVAEAKGGSGDLKGRTKDIVKAARKELEKPAKKSHKVRNFFLSVLGIGAAAGAGYYLWKKSQPVEDPWAESYWEDVAMPEAAEEAVDKAKDAASDAADKAKDVAGDVADKAEEVVDDVKDKLK